MTIEKLEPLSQQPHTFRITLSDGTRLKTQDYVVAALHLRTGMELDEEAHRQLLDAVGKASAKTRAVRMISAAGHSKKELQRRLVEKGERVEDAQEAVAWLSELKLLDDAKTAEQLVRSAVAKGYGRSRIRQILYEKSIPQAYWEDALSLVPEMDEAIDRFLERRFRGNAPEEKEIKRAVDALLRRGHSYSDIRAGLQRYDESLELDDAAL